YLLLLLSCTSPHPYLHSSPTRRSSDLSTIEIIVAAEPPDAVLEVIDDGPGVAPDEREKIFRRRYRAEESRRLDSGGSGLGLPIAREIAQGYGGDLYLADHPSGARFVMRLPLAV